VVIDYKTDDINADNAPEAAEGYRPQLKAYREAAGQLLGIDASALGAVLLFVTPGVAVKMD
jgi:ATP-dependent exoDNAse (exonuclease V) beta subunit